MSLLRRVPVARADGDKYEDWEKMVRGDLYSCTGPYLCRMRTEARRLTANYNTMTTTDLGVRAEQLAEIFGSVGANVWVEPPLRVDYGVNVKVGDNFYANFDAVFLDCAPITFGNDVLLGPGVHMYAAEHPLDSHTRHERLLEFSLPITVGNKVWIGGRAVILGGVTIGDGCVIGAGSVVTKDVPAYSGGQPSSSNTQGGLRGAQCTARAILWQKLSKLLIAHSGVEILVACCFVAMSSTTPITGMLARLPAHVAEDTSPVHNDNTHRDAEDVCDAPLSDVALSARRRDWLRKHAGASCSRLELARFISKPLKNRRHCAPGCPRLLLSARVSRLEMLNRQLQERCDELEKQLATNMLESLSIAK